jgi:hypothetical protein
MRRLSCFAGWSLKLGAVLALQLLGASAAFPQPATDFENRKIEAYHKFHRGEVHQAAREIRNLATEATDNRRA